MKKRTFLDWVNVPKTICTHLVGSNHSKYHHMGVGTVLIATGVIISSLGEGTVLHLLTEGVGYMIHGFGTVPFIEAFTNEL